LYKTKDMFNISFKNIRKNNFKGFGILWNFLDLLKMY